MSQENDYIALGNSGRWAELYQLGAEAWNIWARSTLDLLDEHDYIIPLGAPLGSPAFDGFEFPHNVTFQPKDTTQRLNFSNSIFHGDVKFQINRQENVAFFQEARFLGKADFSGITFADQNSFANAIFEKEANFKGATFQYTAKFEESKFHGKADFTECTYKLAADFTKCTFGNDATFEHAVFQARPIFTETKFKATVPNFRAAHFASQYAPDFHNARITYPIDKSAKSGTKRLWDRVRKICALNDGSERARILKRLAADGHNHDEEMRFFAMEMKAKRKHEIPYWPPTNWPNLFISHAYECSSNFGQSIIRPLIGLLITALSFAYCYSGLLTQDWRERLLLVAKLDSTVWTTVFVNTVPFAGQVRLGRSITEKALCDPPATHFTSIAACQSELFWISAIEGIFAFIFLFLIGLALRNIARIK